MNLKAIKVLSNRANGFSETLKFEILHQSNVEDNHNKFYCLELQKNPNTNEYRLFSHYGRLGKTSVYDIRDAPNLQVAEVEYEKILKKKKKGKKEKETDGTIKEKRYVKIETPKPTVGSENICNRSVSTVTTKVSHIDTSSLSDSHVARIIDQVAQENIHNITTKTTLTLTSSGFETPLGPVTKQHVQKARQPLELMNSLLRRGKLDETDKKVREANNLYYSLIPHPFGHKILPSDWILSAEKLEDEFDLLDQLETAVQMGSAMQQSAKQKLNALGTEMERVTDNKEIERIRNYIEKSKAHNHRNLDVWKYKMKNIFKICIPEERKRYEKNGKKLGNIKELFHGSRNCNILSILKGGLIIPSVNAGHVTGRLFGNGLYFAHNSTKSLNYSTGWWARSRNKFGNCFLFLADVAMGKEYMTHSHFGNPPSSYSSLHAKKGSQLQNDEYIVYNLNQCSLTYLVEMKN